MENTENMKSFLSQVDSIQSRFPESLITGQRKPILKEKAAPNLESKDEAHQVYIDISARDFLNAYSIRHLRTPIRWLSVHP